jgi:hypothetical protein
VRTLAQAARLIREARQLPRYGIIRTGGSSRPLPVPDRWEALNCDPPPSGAKEPDQPVLVEYTRDEHTAITRPAASIVRLFCLVRPPESRSLGRRARRRRVADSRHACPGLTLIIRW